ncbi:hypothetical protein [Rhodococcus sp. LB1]|uniref:hypothetical protein n=1 Tax=Rhodococcus sp. LB1 TaxID=1807499 RepID=UPI000AD49BEC|nr:hypothetical protein [Rhodococcus sp. LB1]
MLPETRPLTNLTVPYGVRIGERRRQQVRVVTVRDGATQELNTDRQAIPVPRHLVTCPHYLLPGLDGRAEITIPTTACLTPP